MLASRAATLSSGSLYRPVIFVYYIKKPIILESSKIVTNTWITVCNLCTRRHRHKQDVYHRNFLFSIKNIHSELWLACSRSSFDEVSVRNHLHDPKTHLVSLYIVSNRQRRLYHPSLHQWHRFDHSNKLFHLFVCSIVLTNSFNWFSSTRFKSIFFPRRFFMNFSSLRWALNPSRWVILLSLLSDVVLDVLTKPGSTGGNEAQTISFVRPFWNYESAKQNIIKTEEVNIFIWKI